jgi:hypothetical protein
MEINGVFSNHNFKKNIGAANNHINDPYKRCSDLLGCLNNPIKKTRATIDLINLSKQHPVEIIHPLVKGLDNKGCSEIIEDVLLNIAYNHAYPVCCQLTGKLNNPQILPKVEILLEKIGGDISPQDALSPLLKCFLLNTGVSPISEKIILKIAKKRTFETSQEFISKMLNPNNKNKMKELFNKIAFIDISKTYKPLMKCLGSDERSNIAKEILQETALNQPYKAVMRFIKTIDNPDCRDIANDIENIALNIFKKLPGKSMRAMVDLLEYGKHHKTIKRLLMPLIYKYPCDGISLLLIKFGYPEYSPIVEELLTEAAKNSPRITKQLLEQKLNTLLNASSLPLLTERTTKAIEFYINLPKHGR